MNKKMKIKEDLNFELLDEIASRWSGRAFAAKKLEKDTILQVLEAARWAPSSYNEQPWAFIVGLKGSKNFELILESLSSGNSSWAKNAGALILTLSITELERNGKFNKFAQYDLGQSVAFLSLEAERLGLNVHQMGGFDVDKVGESFKIKSPYQVMSVLAIGFRGDPEILDEALKQKELSQQRRKRLEKKVFFEEFNQ
ncbi:nitroreductase family protein [Hyphobacterium sp. CCMP332]|nr:nitroreductase family protein [Hyphobacterium sp. CCMP332]